MYYLLITDHVRIRLEILINEGLGGYKDHPIKIIVSALNKYSQTDPEFSLKYLLVQSQFQELVLKLWNRDPNLMRAFEDFAKDIIEEQDSLIPMRQSSKV